MKKNLKWNKVVMKFQVVVMVIFINLSNYKKFKVINLFLKVMNINLFNYKMNILVSLRILQDHLQHNILLIKKMVLIIEP